VGAACGTRDEARPLHCKRLTTVLPCLNLFLPLPVKSQVIESVRSHVLWAMVWLGITQVVGYVLARAFLAKSAAVFQDKVLSDKVSRAQQKVAQEDARPMPLNTLV